MLKSLFVGWLLVVCLLLGVGIYLNVVQYTSIEPQYNRAIGDWAKNAADAPTFQQSITFLQKFNASMNSEGLSPSMYNSAFSWDQTPQNSMVFQYSYVGQMINRANYYINYTSANHAGQLTDIYNTALTNFRSEMTHNGPLDWVAHDAWYLKNYPFYWWYGWYFLAIGLPLAGIIPLSLWLANRYDDKMEEAAEAKRWRA